MSEKTLGPWDGLGPPPTGAGTTRTAPEPVEPDEIVADSLEGEPIEIVAEPVAEGEEVQPGAVALVNGEEAPVGDDGIPVLQVADEGWEPADHNVDQVRKYLSANPDQAEFVLDRERAGKSRASLIGA